jgi:hypothetical protein
VIDWIAIAAGAAAALWVIRIPVRGDLARDSRRAWLTRGETAKSDARLGYKTIACVCAFAFVALLTRTVLSAIF